MNFHPEGRELRLYTVIWKDDLSSKVASKHRVAMDEVEEILFSSPHVRKIEKGRIKGENLYVAYGQTHGGRYLVVFFIHKRGNAALPVSARDMTLAERKYYNAKKKED
jgi:uncharacterized DUF497 family protein